MCVHYSGTVSSPIVSTLERVAESLPQLTVHWVPQSQALNREKERERERRQSKTVHMHTYHGYSFQNTRCLYVSTVYECETVRDSSSLKLAHTHTHTHTDGSRVVGRGPTFR